MTFAAPASRAWPLLMILCCLPLTGCITRLLGGAGEPTVSGEKESIPLSKLERIIYNFADRDVTLISDACESIKRETVLPEERRRAQHFKLANGTAVYDIVTSPNSLGHLVDLYVMIQLQHRFLIDEGNAVRLYGDKGAARLSAALERVRTEVGHITDLAMKSARKEHLDKMIQDWRERNPKVEFVSGIRFGNLPELSGKSILEILPSFFDVINPMDDTSRSVDETRHLAERAFYFSKRLPRLLDWQTDAAVDDLLAKPELNQVLKDATQTSGSIDRVSKVIERVPDLVAAERKAFLEAWDALHPEAVSVLKEVRETGEALESTFDALQRVLGPFHEAKRNRASKPFDITEYTAAAAEIGRMARDANDLVSSSAWTKRQEDVARLAGEVSVRAEQASRRVLDHLAWRMVEVLIAGFALLVLYRVFVRLIDGRKSPPDPSRPAQIPELPKVRDAAPLPGNHR